jgi:hypothetical protein
MFGLLWYGEELYSSVCIIKLYDKMIQNEWRKRERSKGMSTHKVWFRKQTWFWLVTTIISLFFLVTNTVPFSLSRSSFSSHHSFTSYSFLLPDAIDKPEKGRVTTIHAIKCRQLKKKIFFLLSLLTFFA